MFKHLRSPDVSSNGIIRSAGKEGLQRTEYLLKECRETLAQERLLKDTRIEELERQLLDEGKRTERTESDKRFLFDLQARQADELTELKAEVGKTRASNDASLRELRTANAELREQLIGSEDRARAEKQSLNRELENLQMSTENQRRAMDALRTDLTTKNDMLTEKNNLIVELEKRCEEYGDTRTKSDPNDLAFITKELANALKTAETQEFALASQTAKIHALQDVNAKLSIVKEENHALKLKLELMDGMREDLAKAQVELAKLDRQRVQWEHLIDDTNGFDPAQALAKQKKDLDSATSQLKLLEEQLIESNVLIDSVRKDHKACQSELSQYKAFLVTEKRSSARLERMNSLTTREVQFLREQLKSYDLEEQQELPNFDKVKGERITELERLVDEYRLQSSAAVEDKDSNTKAGSKRSREDETDFNNIERGEYLRKIRSLNSELEITKREYSLLEKQLSAQTRIQQPASKDGEQGPTIRVLQHKMNPTIVYQAVRTQTLKDLRLENEMLLAELQGKGGVTVPIQTLRNTESEVRQLEETIRQKDKMILRLKEVFAAKSSEFREAVYSLLGYRLDFLPNGRVRLTSMYAGKTEHGFLFDGEAGTMQLCGEVSGDQAFMDSVGNLIKYWSGEKNSIPGMLSALTLELLEKEAQVTT